MRSVGGVGMVNTDRLQDSYEAGFSKGACLQQSGSEKDGD